MKHTFDLTAYLLGELPENERAAIDAALAADPELRAELDSVRATHEALFAALAKETGPEPRVAAAPVPFPARHSSRRWLAFLGSPAGAAAIAACAVLGAGLALHTESNDTPGRRAETPVPTTAEPALTKKAEARTMTGDIRDDSAKKSTLHPTGTARVKALTDADSQWATAESFASESKAVTMPAGAKVAMPAAPAVATAGTGKTKAAERPNTFRVHDKVAVDSVSALTGKTQVAYESNHSSMGAGDNIASAWKTGRAGGGRGLAGPRSAVVGETTVARRSHASGNRYDAGAVEQAYMKAAEQPLSTFSVDVNTASYAFARRSINTGVPLAPQSVRIEEWLNNFTYAYPEPEAPHPVAAFVEGSDCPWNPEHRLVRIGLRAKTVAADKRPASNLVFLIDTSGSMESQDRLPLAQESLLKLLARLDERDRVGIVTYAGSSGIAAEPTVCDAEGKKKLEKVILGLSSAGSTNGASGLRSAYALAAKNLNPEGVNRVILATDGDFNVGLSGTAEIVDLAKREAGRKVFLTVLGFGTGNLNADLMKQLSVKADGNHYYIDSLREGERVLSQKLTGTLVTVARDVKLQIDFNPARVAAYRLIGYDTRRLANEDFNDDTKDAGEMGAGHTVTALYEIIPVGATPPVDSSRYVAKAEAAAKPAALSDEWLTVKVRYQPPSGGKSTLIEKPLPANGVPPLAEASSDQKFAAAVTEAALALRNSEHKGAASIDGALELLEKPGVTGDDADRREFADLLRLARHR